MAKEVNSTLNNSLSTKATAGSIILLTFLTLAYSRLIFASLVVFALAYKLNHLAEMYGYTFSTLSQPGAGIWDLLVDQWGFLGVAFLLFSSLWTIVSPFFLTLISVALSSEVMTLLINGNPKAVSTPASILIALVILALILKGNRKTQLLEDESLHSNFSDKTTGSHLLDAPLGRR